MKYFPLCPCIDHLGVVGLLSRAGRGGESNVTCKFFNMQLNPSLFLDFLEYACGPGGGGGCDSGPFWT